MLGIRPLVRVMGHIVRLRRATTTQTAMALLMMTLTARLRLMRM